MCTGAPPSSAAVMFSPITCFTTAGPVRNIWLVFWVMKMKSLSAGE